MAGQSPARIWTAAADTLHDQRYRRQYADLLAQCISSREKAILDTACGTGFPLLDLLERGYTRITGADADAEELAILRETLQRKGMDVPLVRTRWERLAQDIKGRFDVVLNVDSSLPYMDSWSGKPLARISRNAPARLGLALQNFRALLNPSGTLVAALPKNNLRTNTHLSVDIGERRTESGTMHVTWELHFDWEKKVKVWDNIIEADGKRTVRTLQSYLFTRDELARLLEENGFSDVHALDTPRLYDDILTARAP